MLPETRADHIIDVWRSSGCSEADLRRLIAAEFGRALYFDRRAILRRMKHVRSGFGEAAKAELLEGLAYGARVVFERQADSAGSPGFERFRPPSGELARLLRGRRKAWRSERTIIALVMQSVDNSLVVSGRRRLGRPGPPRPRSRQRLPRRRRRNRI